MLTGVEQANAGLLVDACKSIIKHLGGKDCNSRFTASFIVLF